MSAIPWATVRDGIQSWIATGSGLAGDHVVWSGQRDADGNLMPRPTGMYILLRLTLLSWDGLSDWDTYEYNAGTNTFTQHLRGPRSAVLTVTCFQGAPTGGTGQPSPSSTMAVLNDAMTASGLDTVSNVLVAAGVGVGDIDAINVAGGTINEAKFEERSIATVKIHLASSVDSVYPVGQGWIDVVNADGIAPGDLNGLHVHVVAP